jgi:hypothetical protein
MKQFTDQEKRIYGPYPRGDGQVVMGDPLRILRRLTYHLGGDPNEVLAKQNSPDPGEKYQADEAVYPAVCQAFDLVPFDPLTGKGTTEAEAQEILDHYRAWVGEPVAEGGSGPTCSPLTESAPAVGIP